MEILGVVFAAVASFVLGWIWYSAFSAVWVEASGVVLDERGKPKHAASAKMLAGAFLAQLLVAGMMRHIFSTSGIDGPVPGFVSGVGVGLFFITPWIAMNNGYVGRPWKLTVIDGGYATVGCGLMGVVLGLARL